jgi:hypothetical protein
VCQLNFVLHITNPLISLHPLLQMHKYQSTRNLDKSSSLTCAISCHFDTAKSPEDQCKFVIVLKHHSMTVYGGSVCTAPLILNLGT